jgi:hypothetical protein
MRQEAFVGVVIADIKTDKVVFGFGKKIRLSSKNCLVMVY